MPDTTVSRFQKPCNTQVDEFAAIAQTYPPDGPDARILTLLQDSTMDLSRLAQTLGCCKASISQAKKRLRTFAQTGTAVPYCQRPGREEEAQEFTAIAQTYPADGPDREMLTWLRNPDVSLQFVAETLGCDREAIRKAKQRLRRFAQTGILTNALQEYRTKEAAEFAQIAETYPADGLDIKVLMWLKNPEASMPFIAQVLGRDDRSIRYAKKRLRTFAQTGTVRPNRKREALPTDPAAVESWLEAPLPVSRAGRKRWKRGAGGEASRAA